PFLLDDGQGAGLKQRLPANAAPAYLRSPSTFRRRFAFVVSRDGTAHVHFAPILRLGTLRQRNFDNAPALRTRSALAAQVGAQANLFVAKRALKVDGFR